MFYELPFDSAGERRVFEIENTQYNYELLHNDQNDFYTMNVYDSNDDVIYTTKLCNATDAMHAFKEYQAKIIPSSPEDYNLKYIKANFKKVNIYEYN